MESRTKIFITVCPKQQNVLLHSLTRYNQRQPIGKEISIDYSQTVSPVIYFETDLKLIVNVMGLCNSVLPEVWYGCIIFSVVIISQAYEIKNFHGNVIS